MKEKAISMFMHQSVKSAKMSPKAQEKAEKLLLLAQNLTEEYLSHKDVTVKFSRGVSIAGQTFHRQGGPDILITLSKVFIEDCDYSMMEDTLRHEIAHAVAGPDHGHDKVWKRAAIMVGAKPNRCHDVHLDHRRKWILVCPTCGFTTYRARIRKNMHYSCPKCHPNTYDPNFLLEQKENPDYIKLSR